MIIGLTGRARSGKDTVGELLRSHDEMAIGLQIAGPLKAYCRHMFDWTEAHTDGDLKDVPDERYPRPCVQCDSTGTQHRCRSAFTCPQCNGKGHIALTPRHAMQQLGGEWAEATFPSIYAVRAARSAEQLVKAGNTLVVVTDCRFLRDIEAVKGVGGIIVQVHRPSVEAETSPASKHASERAWDDPKFRVLVNHHLINDGTLADLRVKVFNLYVSLTQCPF